MRVFKTVEVGVLLALVLMVGGLEIGSRSIRGRTFFDSYNVQRITRDFSFVGIASIGAVIVIVSGGVDLSAGSVMGVSAVTLASLYTVRKWDPTLCLLAALLAGGACGWLNGLFIGKLKVPPFIATLGMMSIASGLSYLVTQGLNINILWQDTGPQDPLIFNILGTHPFLVLLIALLLSGILMSYFKWGRMVYALGSNEECARFSGLNLSYLKGSVYTLAGLFSGLAGAAYALRYGYASTATGKGYELQIIAACVVGGASFTGGQGSVLGAGLGACILQLLKEALVLYDVKEEYVQVVYGLTIIVAVSVDTIRNRHFFPIPFLTRKNTTSNS